MDRRMLLAMALAVLVLVANAMIFGPRGRRQAPPQLADSTATEAAVPELASKPIVPSPNIGAPGTTLRDPLAEADTTESVIVDTDLVQAEFNPMGGALRSWKLRRFTDAANGEADLVRNPEIGAIWLSIRDGDLAIRTDSTRFRTEVSREPGLTRVRFHAADPRGFEITKTYLIPNDRYDCRMEIAVRGLGESSEGGYCEIGWASGMPTLEKDPRTDYAAMAGVALFGKNYVKTGGGGGSFGCAATSSGVKSEDNQGTLRWFGVRNRYFLGALILDQPRDRQVTTRYDGTTHDAGALLREPLSMSGLTELGYRLYLGPIHYGILDGYKVGLERVQDLGPGIFRPFSILLMKFFEGANRVIPNYGIEIIILSILIRLLFYPLTKKSMDSMKRMQALKPEIDKLNARFKDDPEKRNREIMDLYKKYKINPIGGCLPMVIQLPVLSGLYFVLANAVQLRKEPFIFWIKDMAAPDTVAHLAGIPVNPLPLLMAATMVWQQKITPTDPRQASLGYIMPIFMTFLFYSMASGLVLYWTVSNLMTVLQQIWMNRNKDQALLVPIPQDAPPAGGRKKR